MALLDGYWDPTLEIDLAVSPEQVTATEVARLQAAVAVLLVTSEMPRRLGGDATREELALDKRRARRALHVERQSLVTWGGKERTADSEEQRAGAQLTWESWHEDFQVVLRGRLLYVGTWAKRTGNLRVGKSAIVRLKQELDWMAYALRD